MRLSTRSLRAALSHRLQWKSSEVQPALGVDGIRRLFSATPNLENDVRIYNSLSKEIEKLPECDKAIAWYTCGPTTYAPAHLGHARTYVCIDIMRRVLEAHVSKPPLFTMNITDIDDKILMAAQETGESPLELARRYEREFWEDMDSLNCLRPHIVARVTERVESDIIPYIRTLFDKGMAYDTEDGIYFDVKNFSDRVCCFSEYGKLSPHSASGDDTKTPNSTVKRDQRDFVLWKKQKSTESVYWDAPWGRGRPGWHIECSAMIESIQSEFEDTHIFSVHAGGVDLQFPHHTNEIAQAEAYKGEEWIKHWVHTGHLHIDGLKMSKSLKNFISIRDFLGKYDVSSTMESPADDFRLWCLGLSGSYRAPATFSESRLSEARNKRQKIFRFLHGGEAWLSSANGDTKLWNEKDIELHKLSLDAKHKCTMALQNDFDGTKFLGKLMKVVETGNTYFATEADGSVESVRTALHTVRDLLRLVGFSPKTTNAGLDHDIVVTSTQKSKNNEVVDTLVALRSQLRKVALDQTSREEASKELLKLCDNLRDTMLEQGVEIRDSQNGESDGWRPCLQKSTEKATFHQENSTKAHQDLCSVELKDLFRVGVYEKQFSQYGADGVPTHDADGLEVSKRMLKKLLKKREAHKKRLQAPIKE